MRAFLAVAALGTILIASIAAGAPAPSVTKPRTLVTRGPVISLAADGERAALIQRGTRGVLVWDPHYRRVVTLRSLFRDVDCGSHCGMGRMVALAGPRVGWEESAWGQTTSESFVGSASLARRAPVALGDGALRVEGTGAVAFRVAGDGGLLAFTVEEYCGRDSEGNSLCPPGRKPGDVIAATVWRLAGRGRCPYSGSFAAGHCARVANADGKLTVLAVDNGRVAARTDDGIVLLTGVGGRLQDFPVVKVLAAALSRNRLAVRVPGSVEIYDTGSGQLIRHFDVASGLRLEDLDHGILVTAKLRTVTLRRLTDGRTATIRTQGIAHAQLEPAGLFVAAGRRVTFTSMRDVLRRLGD
jgi:hypothetical protein